MVNYNPRKKNSQNIKTRAEEERNYGFELCDHNNR